MPKIQDKKKELKKLIAVSVLFSNEEKKEWIALVEFMNDSQIESTIKILLKAQKEQEIYEKKKIELQKEKIFKLKSVIKIIKKIIREDKEEKLREKEGNPDESLEKYLEKI